MSVQLNITLDIAGQYNGNNPLAAAVANFALKSQASFAPGTGLGQADKMFAASRTIAASANDDIDLAGSLVDPLGAVVVFAGIKAIFVEALATNVNDVLIGPAATNGFLGPWSLAADKTRIRPGEFFCITNRSATGWAVTAGTGDLLRLTNGGAGSTVGYNIVLVGDSA